MLFGYYPTIHPQKPKGLKANASLSPIFKNQAAD